MENDQAKANVEQTFGQLQLELDEELAKRNLKSLPDKAEVDVERSPSVDAPEV